MQKTSNRGRSKGGLKTLSRAHDNPVVQELIEYGQSFPGVQGMSKVPTPLAPLSTRVVLSYGFDITISTAAGEVDSQVFRGSGMFDPDVTGVGAQPLGFDQWSAFYGRNRVVASAVEFSASTPDATTNDAAMLNVGIFPAVGGSLPTTIAAARSMPYARFKTLNGTDAVRNRIVSSMESSVIQGIPNAAVLIDDNLCGTPSSDPSEIWYWIILTQPTDQAAATSIRLSGTVHYLADFFDKSLLSLSATDNKSQRKASSLVKALSIIKK